MLTSCEGFLHFTGRVYDRNSQAPLHGVHVTWLIGGWEREEIQMEYDTLSVAQRKLLRKQTGKKDGYGYWGCCPLNDVSHKGYGRDSLVHYIASYTNDTGGFFTGPMLFSFAAGPPKVKLVFSKDGYKTDTVTVKKNTSRDDLKVFLEKE